MAGEVGLGSRRNLSCESPARAAIGAELVDAQSGVIDDCLERLLVDMLLSRGNASGADHQPENSMSTTTAAT